MSFSPVTQPLGARSTVVGTTSGPTTTSATFVAIPEMSITLNTNGRPCHVFFDATVTITATTLAGDQIEIALFLDGTEIPDTRRSAGYASGLVVSSDGTLSADAPLIGLAAGSHTIDARYRRPSGSGTARLVTTKRRLTVEELYAQP